MLLPQLLCRESLRHIYDPTSNLGFKKIIPPQIQWYSTSEALRFALAPNQLSQYILKRGMDSWCHTKGGLRVDKENAVPLLLVCGGSREAPYQIQRKVRWGGRQSRQAQLSLIAVLGSSTRFQTMQRNCLSLLGHRACMFTALIPCQCCPRKTQAAGRKQISSSQLVITTKKTTFKKVLSVANFIRP